jgi:threonine synthase
LTSANSINVARFLPQAFYYFHGYAQLARLGLADRLVVCVPSGNFGNLCAALVAHRMGLPVRRFIAANNRNDVFFNYLQTGSYTPRPSIRTLANAMDVGDPSNFARILDLYSHRWTDIRKDISGAVVGDGTILTTIRQCRAETGYVLDPHGACGYRALKDGLHDGETGLFCETAHPAKFRETVSRALKDGLREGKTGARASKDGLREGETGLRASKDGLRDGKTGLSGTSSVVPLPDRLAAFLTGTKQTIPLPASFPAFKSLLLTQGLY